MVGATVVVVLVVVVLVVAIVLGTEEPPESTAVRCGVAEPPELPNRAPSRNTTAIASRTMTTPAAMARRLTRALP